MFQVALLNSFFFFFFFSSLHDIFPQQFQLDERRKTRKMLKSVAKKKEKQKPANEPYRIDLSES